MGPHKLIIIGIYRQQFCASYKQIYSHQMHERLMNVQCICDAIATHALSALTPIHQHFDKLLLLKAFLSAHSGCFHLYIFRSISLLSVSYIHDTFSRLYFFYLLWLLSLFFSLLSATHTSFLVFFIFSLSRHPFTLLSNISTDFTPAPYKTSSFHLSPLTTCQPILSLFPPPYSLSFYIICD